VIKRKVMAMLAALISLGVMGGVAVVQGAPPAAAATVTYVCPEPIYNVAHQLIGTTIVIGATKPQCQLWAQEILGSGPSGTSPDDVQSWFELACYIANFIGIPCMPPGG